MVLPSIIATVEGLYLEQNLNSDEDFIPSVILQYRLSMSDYNKECDCVKLVHVFVIFCNIFATVFSMNGLSGCSLSMQRLLICKKFKSKVGQRHVTAGDYSLLHIDNAMVHNIQNLTKAGILLNSKFVCKVFSPLWLQQRSAYNLAQLQPSKYEICSLTAVVSFYYRFIIYGSWIERHLYAVWSGWVKVVRKNLWADLTFWYHLCWLKTVSSK